MEVDCQEEFSSMYLGDMIHLVIPKSEIGKVKDLLL